MAGCCVWLVLMLSVSVTGLTSPREFTPEDEEFLVEVLSMKASELEVLVQSGRKFLRKVREWHGSHPAESLLAKCVLQYWFEVKIPVIVAAAQEDNFVDGRRGLSTPVWIEHHTPEDEPQTLANFQDPNSVQDRIFDNGDSVEEVTRMRSASLGSLNGDGKFKFKRKVVKALYLLYTQLKELLSEYKLVGCSVHYLIAKFWEWVDNAP